MKALIAYNNLTRWVSFHENPQCVKAGINHDYWHSLNTVNKSEPTSSFNFWLIVIICIGVAGIIIALVIAYFTCKEKEETETIEGKESF